MPNQYTHATHCKNGHPFEGDNLINTGGQRRCRTCQIEYQRQYRARNREKTRRYANDYYRTHGHGKRISKSYGLDRDEYDQLLAEQGGVCAICKNDDVKALAVDHCHETGRIRGLLCNKCNRGLGLLGDSYDAILRVLDYLREDVNARVEKDPC